MGERKISVIGVSDALCGPDEPIRGSTEMPSREFICPGRRGRHSVGCRWNLS